MNVTVCELNDDPVAFAEDWQALAAHVKAERSQLVVLPEMPFAPWFALSPRYDAAVWQAAVSAHEAGLGRLEQLAPAIVISTRPVTSAGKRLNEGFVWDQASGYRVAHHKYYLPDEDGFWEASWYNRGDGSFAPVQSGRAKIGFLICTEQWFMERGRFYGKQGVHLIVTPRATGKPTVEKWLMGGRAVAVVSGAFSLSSNRFSSSEDLGGQGWVVGPDGQVLGVTSRQQPFLTVSIDLAEAERAKKTYPRYVLD
jgi:N-carbamoylputrescine amidase